MLNMFVAVGVVVLCAVNGNLQGRTGVFIRVSLFSFSLFNDATNGHRKKQSFDWRANILQSPEKQKSESAHESFTFYLRCIRVYTFNTCKNTVMLTAYP